jgi:ferrous iron transport protein B
MLMGLGCNAAGVTGCRILDSPKERLAAILTNAFIPCNGRFPALLAGLSCLGLSSGWAAMGLFGIFLLSVGMTLLVTKGLTATVLRGQPSVFTLELPPYRLPDVGRTLIRSLLDRTGRILLRAITAAAPAGGILWLLQRGTVGDGTVWQYLTERLDPIGRFLGMDGILLLAFLLALPAAELMLPLALSGGIAEISGDIPALFAQNGWDTATVLCFLLFTLFHFPCATTLITICRETHRLRWGILAALLPTAIGCLLCLTVRLITGG